MRDRRATPGVDEAAAAPAPTPAPPADAARVPANEPGPAANEPYRPPEHPWGIALSGGGIRSASFSLGVLQAMRGYAAAGHPELLEGPVESRATYITSVSGGSYIAGALAMLKRGKFPNDPDVGGEVPVSPGCDPRDDIPAFAAGSPEERYLRDHTRYLSHGFGGPLGAVWRLLLSVILNFTLLALLVMTIGFPLGWLYGWRVGSLRYICPSGPCAPHNFSFPSWALVLVPVVVGGLGILVGLIWVMGWFARQSDKQNLLLVVSLSLVGAAMLWLLAVIALPIVLEWLRVSVGKRPIHKVIVPADRSSAALAAATGGGAVLSTLTALFGARVARTVDAGWQKLPAGAQTALRTKAKNLLLRLRVPLINLVVTLIGPATVAGLALLALHLGALYVPNTSAGGVVWPIVGVAMGGVLLALAWRFADLTQWSLHPFYRERLAAAFSLKRFDTDATFNRKQSWQPTKVETPAGKWQAADRRPYEIRYSIKDAQPPDMPKFVICAAANVSTYGATPTGYNATSFVFSDYMIGGPIVGSCTAAYYEDVIGRFDALSSTITFQAAIAMSGAAVSPEMGRMTRAPLRFLLTLANVRLGVWVPNPHRLAWFAKKKRKKNVKPRITYLLYEMLGKNKINNKYLYVTDGGHYENLGLVEQLRRGSLYVFCVDASGEQQDNFGTIAGAVALAYSECNIRIDITPEVMAPDPTETATRAASGLPPCVQSTFCVGNIHYPVGDPNHKDGALGRLVVIKAGVPIDAPLDISDFQARNPKFPCDPTLDQLYDAERFDAYRSLGNVAADQAFAYVGGDFERFRTTKSVGAWGGASAAFGPPA
ncbi:MAG: hypothetical protein ACLPQS_00530 [Acidimicrobiales bacterium]